jgi:RimJ/RimL family protein N-acetyltransferase
MVIAETPRLILRQLNSNDGGAMDAVLGDAEVMRYGHGPQSPQWVRSWIAAWGDDYYRRWGFGAWAVVDKGTAGVVGYCGLSRFPERCAAGEVEIGFRLARAHWGRGFATEAATAVTHHAFGALGLPRIVALIDPANAASIRVAEKLGFRYERDAMLPGYDHPDRLYALQHIAGGRPGAATHRGGARGAHA